MISMETKGANANWQQNKSGLIGLIEQKGMTFDNDFGYSFPLFSSRKGEYICKNRDQRSCLSARSNSLCKKFFLRSIKM